MSKEVLVVEDDLHVRTFLRVFLELEGLVVSESGSVGEALAACKKNRFDLVMLDYNLGDDPKGWSVAEEVRAHPDLYGTPKIIAMSGTVGPDAANNLGLEETCFDLFLSKPFNSETFRGHLKRLLGT